jgi:hypothetical protein
LKAIGRLIQSIIALLILIGAAIGAVRLVRWGLCGLFSGISPTVGAAIVAAFATVFGSVLTIVVGRYLERKKLIEADIRTAKLPVYTKLIQGLFEGLLVRRNQDNSEHFEKLMAEATPNLIIWASDDVLKAWSRYRRINTTNLVPREMLVNFEELIKAFRRDYGHSTKSLATGDIMGTFINDVEEVLSGQSDTI